MKNKYISTKLLYKYLINKSLFKRNIKNELIKCKKVCCIRCVAYRDCLKIQDNIKIDIEKLEFRSENEIIEILDNYYQKSDFYRKITINYNIFNWLIENHKIDCKFLFDKVYINKKEVQQIKLTLKNIVDNCKITSSKRCVPVKNIRDISMDNIIARIIIGELEGEKINSKWYLSLDSYYEISNDSLNINEINSKEIAAIRNQKEWISISKIMKLLHMTRYRVYEYIKQLAINPQIKNNSTYLTKEDFTLLCNFVTDAREKFNNREVYFTSKDTKELIGINGKAFLANKTIQSKIRKPIEFEGKLYFYCSDIEKIKKIVISQHNPTNINNNMTKVCKHLNTTPETIIKYIKNGFFKNSKITKKGKIFNYYIDSKDIELYKKTFFFKFDSNYDSIVNVCDKYNVSRELLVDKLNNIAKVSGKCYVLISEVEQLLGKNKKTNNKKISLYNSHFTYIARELHVSNSKLVSMVENDEFPHTLKEYRDNKIFYKFDQSDLDNYKTKYFYVFDDNYCSTLYLKTKFNVGEAFINKNISKLYTYGNQKYCNKKEGIKICKKKSQLDKLLHNLLETNNKNDAYNYYVLLYRERINDNMYCKSTIKLFDEFIRGEINKSNSRHILGIVYYNGPSIIFLSNILNNLQHELYELDSFKIDKYILSNKNMSKNLAISLGKFMNYVRLQTKGKCKYDTKFVRKANKTNKTHESYNFELFSKYAEYVSNYNLHINDAIEDPSYAQLWLYSIFHFCTAWRSGDILDFPYFPESAQLGKNLSWFKNNKLCEHDCEVIIKLFYDNYFIANKNRNKIILQVFKLFQLSFSTAIYICELHRENYKKDKIFFSYSKYSPNARQIERFLSKSEDLPRFTSLALNRSFISNFYDFTSSKTELHNVAYYLSRKLRGHKTENMTWQYINSLPNDDRNLCSVLLFENDTFGYIKYYLSELILIADNKDFSSLSLSDRRDYMINKYKLPNVLEIEAFSKTLLLEQQLKIDIIDSLLKYDYNSLIERLSMIYKGISPSFNKAIHCLDYNKCPQKKAAVKNCEVCRNAIFTKQFLIELNTKLINNLTKLDTLDSVEDINYKKTFIYVQRLLLILKQALDKEIGLGIDVVNVYINIDNIKIYLKNIYIKHCINVVKRQITDGNNDNVNYLVSKLYELVHEENVKMDNLLNYDDLVLASDNRDNYHLLESVSTCLIDELCKNSINKNIVEQLVNLLKIITSKVIECGASKSTIIEKGNFNKISLLLKEKGEFSDEK